MPIRSLAYIIFPICASRKQFPTITNLGTNVTTNVIQLVKFSQLNSAHKIKFKIRNIECFYFTTTLLQQKSNTKPPPKDIQPQLSTSKPQ